VRILLAEDDCRLGKLIEHMLVKEKIQVDWVQQGNVAFEYATYAPYDVLVLDWMLPGETGINVCGRLRKNGYQGSILMLTARDALEDRILGLDTGADDYIVKPFEFAELMARIRALARRSGLQLKEEIVQVGDLVLNRSAHTAIRGRREIQLTVREFQLLDLLVQNNGCVLSRELLLDRSMEYQINWHIIRSQTNCPKNLLGIFYINITANGNSQKANGLLPVD